MATSDTDQLLFKLRAAFPGCAIDVVDETLTTTIKRVTVDGKKLRVKWNSNDLTNITSWYGEKAVDAIAASLILQLKTALNENQDTIPFRI